MAIKLQVRSANWHLTTNCNYGCKFCFSKNLDAELEDLICIKKILAILWDKGIEKINFVGGEPMLHPLIFDIVKIAKKMGFVVSIVSNGYYLNKEVIYTLSPFVDWIGLSIDSADENVEITLGRGKGDHIKHIRELAMIIHQSEIKLKINTTVTRLNWMEDMRPLMSKLKPDRWKVFQVLHIKGQNDLHFNNLSITDDQFSFFKSLNQKPVEGCTPIFESSHEMIASYFMLSPSGMVMSNIDGTNKTFVPLESVSHDNMQQVLDIQQYLGRSAIYPW